MSQRFEKVVGRTLEEAYRKMRQQYGDAAVVINTSQVVQGGLWGLFGQKMVELTASVPSALDTPVRLPSAVERRYAEQQQGSPAAEDRDTIQYFENLVRDAQRRMKASGQEPAQPSQQRRSGRQRGGQAEAAPVVPFPKKKHDEGATGDLSKQVQEIREMMQVLYAENPGAGLPAEFAPHYRTLVERNVSRKVAAALVGAVVRGSDINVIRDSRVFVERLHLELRKMVKVTGGIRLHPGECRRVALCGPTGVGKTTSLAKLAARFAIRERARVALITTDTYRVGAPEQLKVYSNIIGLPLKIANDVKSLKEALQYFADYDLVLIDTAGGSQFNLEQIRELQGILATAQPHETILSMSATTQLDDLRNIAANFKALKPNSVMFTKLDETSRYGAMFSLLVETNLPLAYISIGQNVPDDIRVGNAATIARLIVEGARGRG